MSDHDDRQAPFWRQHHDAVMGCVLPEAHQGVSAGVMRAVWNCYARHVNKHGLTYPSRDRVASITGFSTKQVARAFAALVDSGWLEVVQPARQHSSDVCRIIIQTRHHVPSEVYPDIQTRHQVPSEVCSEVSSEVQSKSRPDAESSRLDFDGSQGGHHVPLTIVTKKELVEVDAHESAAPTTTQQDEGREEEVAAPDDLCPDGLTQWMLDSFEQYGFPLGIASATSLMVQLRGYGLTLRQIQAYITERLIDAEMHDKTPRASYLIGDASAWLKARTAEATYRPPCYTPEESAMMEDQYRQAEASRAAFQALSPKEQAAARLRTRQEFERMWNGESVGGVQ